MQPGESEKRECVIRHYDGSIARVVTIDESWAYDIQKEASLEFEIDLDDRLREFILGLNFPDINDYEEKAVNNTSLSYEELIEF